MDCGVDSFSSQELPKSIFDSLEPIKGFPAYTKLVEAIACMYVYTVQFVSMACIEGPQEEEITIDDIFEDQHEFREFLRESVVADPAIMETLTETVKHGAGLVLGVKELGKLIKEKLENSIQGEEAEASSQNADCDNDGASDSSFSSTSSDNNK